MSGRVDGPAGIGLFLGCVALAWTCGFVAVMAWLIIKAIVS